MKGTLMHRFAGVLGVLLVAVGLALSPAWWSAFVWAGGVLVAWWLVEPVEAAS